eukprot:GEMP01011060.1.p1 GENE.GEMP01011060.1~~GEMP01011060.1.p1  ORF type:complete len:724 (+),score=150.59 GEMP01011060.1:66-2237(+)
MPVLSHGVQNIFASLDTTGTRTVASDFLVEFLARNGLHPTDVRLQGLFAELEKLDALKNRKMLNAVEFDECIHSCLSLVRKCVSGELVIPSFSNFTHHFERVYWEAKEDCGGNVATYIPQLACVDPDLFAMSVTTIDGQQFSVGNADVEYCLQSCAKTLSYLIALEQWGSTVVHEHVGTEPSGLQFNSMALKDSPTEARPFRQIPHNPMINAGAILNVSLLFPHLRREKRLEGVMDVWREASMNVASAIGYDAAIYESESRTADRNWCLAYMMKEKHSFRDEVFDYSTSNDLRETLELYFQTCSITSNSEALSVVAATLANGGLNPFTGHQVFSPSNITQVLPLMFACGMYDYSGQWAFDVGVPAKSGVSGCVFAVIPNVCGIAIFSPRLDQVGNSVRAVSAMKKLVGIFAFHMFEVFSGSHVKICPCVRKKQVFNATLYRILFAVMEGDVQAMHAHCQAGAAIFCPDYDGRTCLHMAASESHVTMMEMILDELARRYKDKPADLERVLNHRDRWNGTAYTSAVDCVDIQKLLVRYGADTRERVVSRVSSRRPSLLQCVSQVSIEQLQSSRSVRPYDRLSCPAGAPETNNCVVCMDVPQVLSAAADGDLDELVTFRCAGMNLYAGNYYNRSALHLAASNGRCKALKYLLGQAPRSRWCELLDAEDKWENMPIDDAVREGHAECVQLLKSARETVDGMHTKLSTSSLDSMSSILSPNDMSPVAQ